MTTNTRERLIRRPEVESRTGLKRATLYLKMQRGTFPAPVRIGDRAVAWRESDVDAWIAARTPAGQ